MLEVLIQVHRTLGLYKADLIPFPGSVLVKRAIQKSLGKLPLLCRKLQPALRPSDDDAKVEATTAKRTIMLDYGSLPVINSFKALCYGHILLSFCMLLRAALWAAGGLSAAIFSVADVPFQTPVSLSSELYFDEFLGYYNGKGTNVSSALTAMEIVTATLVNDGLDYPWTTDTHSFLPFKKETHLGPGDYTADTEAHWGTVSCNVATQEDLEKISAVDLDYVDKEEMSAQVRLHFSYGGCDVIKTLTVSNQTIQYGRSWAVTDCSLSEGRARIGMISGTFNSSQKYWLSNLVVITCQPLFYKSNVSLTVALSNDSTTARVVHFTETSRESVWPNFVRGWLGDTPYYIVIDPSIYLSVDTFSRLVISHVSKNRTLDTDLPPAQVLRSFGEVFEAYYASFVTLQAYYPADRIQIVQGTVSKEVSRLFIVDGPAWAVIGIMMFTFLVTVILTYHLHRNQETLKKHMEPMLGDAILFQGNAGMAAYLETLRRTADSEPDAETIDLVRYARKEDLSNWVVWMDRDVLRIKKPSQGSANGNGIALNDMNVP